MSPEWNAENERAYWREAGLPFPHPATQLDRAQLEVHLREHGAFRARRRPLGWAAAAASLAAVLIVGAGVLHDGAGPGAPRHHTNSVEARLARASRQAHFTVNMPRWLPPHWGLLGVQVLHAPPPEPGGRPSMFPPQVFLLVGRKHHLAVLVTEEYTRGHDALTLSGKGVRSFRRRGITVQEQPWQDTQGGLATVVLSRPHAAYLYQVQGRYYGLALLRRIGLSLPMPNYRGQ